MADSQNAEMAVSLVEVVYAPTVAKELQPDAQNSIKDQLLLQALPPYVPPAAPNQHYSPEQFFSCNDCGDKFLLESSLLCHIQRRSVTISYGCRTCTRTVLFYNRCALLAHLRGHSIEPDDGATTEGINTSQEKMTLGSHDTMNDDDSGKNDGIRMEPDAVSLSPLPKDKILLGPFIPMPLDDCGRLIHKGSSQKRKSEESVPNVNNQVSSHGNESRAVTSKDNQLPENKDNDHQSQVVDNKAPCVVSASSHSVAAISGSEKSISLKTKDTDPEPGDEHLQQVPDASRPDDSTPDSELPGCLACKECGTVPQTRDMKDHFLSSNLPVDLQLRCKKCNLILPSSCSFSAHNRIHSQTNPYICPECSREFDLWASLYVHMLYSCFHMFKLVRYRCIQCMCLFSTAVSLEVHLITKHVRPVFKCDACPIACFSIQTLQDHKVTVHGQPSIGTHSYHLCKLCPEQIIPKSLLLLHVKGHSKDDSVRIYVYQCSNCSFFAQKKTVFAVHWASCSRNHKAKAAAVPSALKPDTGLAAQKIVVSPDTKQGSIIKVIYTVPQNNTQVALLPESAVKTVKTVMLPQSRFRKLLPKIDITQKNNKNSLAILKKIAPVGSEGVQKESCDQKQIKYVYMSERKCEANAEDAEAVLCTMASDSRVVENVPVSMDNMDSTSPDSGSFTATNSTNILRLCSSCKKEPTLSSPSASKFPAFCANCAKEHAFVKKDEKVLLLPTNKIVNSEKVDSKINVRLELTSKIEDREKTISSNNNSHYKRNVNSIALNGPTNIKKLKTSSSVSLDNNKYRCHVCKMLISMDWFKVQEHFAAIHPNFKLLALSPKVSKLKLNSTSVRVPFVTKDHCISPKIMCVKKGATESNIDNINEVNEIYVHDVSEDYQLNESCIKKEFNNMDTERDSTHENGGLNESVYYIKKERDIPIDYDLLPSKIKRKKKSSQKASDRSDKEGGAVTPFSSGQIVPAVQQVFASGHKYECSKCHYADSCVESFREHIKLHHADKNALQCMECGMCFVARPSFEKHLFISHHIKDPEAYLQNNCCDTSAKDEKMEDISQYKESSPQLDFPANLVENQCRVCREIFDSAFQLSKHFRTHGMAYLLTKKSRNKVDTVNE